MSMWQTTINYRIEKFDGNGTYLTQWGSQGIGNGQFELSRRRRR